MQTELTEAQVERQDWVDNCIAGMMQELTGQEVDWDMEWAGEIREAFQEIICDKLKLMSPMDFYPYLELERPDLSKPLVKHPLCYCNRSGLIPGSTCDFCSGLRVADVQDFHECLENIQQKVRNFLDTCEEGQYTDTGDATDLLNWIAQR